VGVNLVASRAPLLGNELHLGLVAQVALARDAALEAADEATPDHHEVRDEVRNAVEETPLKQANARVRDREFVEGNPLVVVPDHVLVRLGREDRRREVEGGAEEVAVADLKVREKLVNPSLAP
jgi:hypothetical protein